MAGPGVLQGLYLPSPCTWVTRTAAVRAVARDARQCVVLAPISINCSLLAKSARCARMPC